MHVGDELDVERFGRELLDFFDELSRVGEEPFFGRFRRSLVATISRSSSCSTSTPSRYPAASSSSSASCWMAGRVLSRASDCVSWAEGLLLLTISFSPAIISGVAVQKHCRPIGCDLFSSRTVGLPAMRRTKTRAPT